MNRNRIEFEAKERKEHLLRSITGSPLMSNQTTKHSDARDKPNSMKPKIKPIMNPYMVREENTPFNTPIARHERRRYRMILLNVGRVKSNEYRSANLLADSKAN